MNLFMNKLGTFVPEIKQKKKMLSDQGVVACTVQMELLPEGDYYSEIPYLQVVEQNGVRELLKNEKRVFLVTEEENIALKTAYGYIIYPVYESRDDLKHQMMLQGYAPETRMALADERGELLRMRVVDLSGEKKPEVSGNPFQALAVGVSEDNAVFFHGLEDNASLAAKLEVMESCPSKLQFVQISEEQLSQPWMRALMMERECEVLRVPKIQNSYYEGVVHSLLEGERYQLESSLTVEQLVRYLRKKCGTGFREEDLAWSLDRAAERAKAEGRNLLTMADFSLTREEIGSALDKLKGMTGLSEMKQMALEYAALSREQVKNSKIEAICKHMIFSGEPGTGKTMCAEKVAQIFSEEGQSNGSFVIAFRKDLIGEYVGHTAPKVAKVFQRARHGVLFVDEAGFFLQDGRNGFNDEAIKEFVRYMELYQDVTVIFALYPQEVDDFMQLDAGLSSRIGRIVRFENYTEEELLQIAKDMSAERGYMVEESAGAEIKDYISERKKEWQERFGNAREMRKLVEATIVAKSVRCFEQSAKEETSVLTKEDFCNAVKKLMSEKPKKKRIVGFFSLGEEEGVNGVSY